LRAKPVSRGQPLAERFTLYAGHPPMQYLASWRMQLAAHMLLNGGETVASLASKVGYESEAAFSRAFKKIVGVPPGEWRRHRLAGSRKASVDGHVAVAAEL
jgi:AraC-like DNA-binding protein